MNDAKVEKLGVVYRAANGDKFVVEEKDGKSVALMLLGKDGKVEKLEKVGMLLKTAIWQKIVYFDGREELVH